MKKIAVFILLLNPIMLFSQTTLNDQERLSISGLEVEQASPIPAQASSLLISKINSGILNSGFGGEPNSQFVIVPFVNIVGKEITATAPTMVVLNVEVNFILGDGFNGNKIGAFSIMVKGVGKNENIAYINAFKNINSNSSEFSNFLKNSKDKIINYYNSQCDFILLKSESLANQRNFDGAIFELSNVPQISSNCYQKSLTKITDVYNKKLEFECNSLVVKAKSSIAQGLYDQAAIILETITPGIKCYQEAEILMISVREYKCKEFLGKARGAWASKNVDQVADYLSEISANSPCSQEAIALASEVRAWVSEKDKREWQFKLVDSKRKYDLSKSVIEATRQIGVAYAKNQPKVIYNYRLIGAWR